MNVTPVNTLVKTVRMKHIVLVVDLKFQKEKILLVVAVNMGYSMRIKIIKNVWNVLLLVNNVLIKQIAYNVWMGIPY